MHSELVFPFHDNKPKLQDQTAGLYTRLNIPNLSNWNLSPIAAFRSEGTPYASGITTLDWLLRSLSQLSSSDGF